MPGPGRPADVHQAAHSPPGPVERPAPLSRCGRSCLGASCLSCTWVPVLRGVTGRGPLLGGTRNLLGQPHCWKAQSTCPGLGHGCVGDAHKGSTEASAPPGQLRPPTPHGGRATATCPRGLSPHPRWAGPVVSTPEGITAHGISRPSLCPSAGTPGHRAGWNGRLAGETGRWLLELKPAECVVCSPVRLPGGARLGGCGVSRLHRCPVVSWGTRDCPPSHEGPGPRQRLLEGPRGRGALPRTGSRCCAGPEPGSLRGRGAGGRGGGRAAPAMF